MPRRPGQLAFPRPERCRLQPRRDTRCDAAPPCLAPADPSGFGWSEILWGAVGLMVADLALLEAGAPPGEPGASQGPASGAIVGDPRLGDILLPARKGCEIGTSGGPDGSVTVRSLGYRPAASCTVRICTCRRDGYRLTFRCLCRACRIGSGAAGARGRNPRAQSGFSSNGAISSR